MIPATTDVERIFQFRQEPHNIAPSLGISVLLHAGLIWFVFSYFHFVREIERKENQPHSERVIALTLTPEDIRRALYPQRPASPPGPPAAPSPSRVAASGPKLTAPPPPAAEGPGTALAPAEAPRATRTFEPPPITPKAPKPAPEVILQPDATLAQTAPELVVPSMVILNNVVAKQRRFMRPPPSQRRQPPPAEPVLSIPAPTIGDSLAIIGSTKPPISLPALPVPAGVPSSISGVGPKKPAPAPVATVSGTGMDTVSIISIPSRPVPAADTIVLPPVAVLGGKAGGAAGGGGVLDGQDSSRTGVTGDHAGASGGRAAAGLAGAGAPGPVGAAGGIPGGTGNTVGLGPTGAGAGRAGTGIGAPGGSGTGGAQGGAATDGIGSGGTLAQGNGAGSGEGAGSGGSGRGGSGGGGAVSEPNAVRIARTWDGKQEIVVTQTTSSIPGTAGLLSGRPVYTVYIPMGSAKEWILQYCLPAKGAEQPRTRTFVLELGSGETVTAPYALVIYRPSVRLRPGARYAFVHAVINEAGRFEGLKEVGITRVEGIEAILHALARWEFRPAFKDGTPVPIEVLVCIPNDFS